MKTHNGKIKEVERMKKSNQVRMGEIEEIKGRIEELEEGIAE